MCCCSCLFEIFEQQFNSRDPVLSDLVTGRLEVEGASRGDDGEAPVRGRLIRGGAREHRRPLPLHQLDVVLVRFELPARPVEFQLGARHLQRHVALVGGAATTVLQKYCKE